MEEEEEEMDVDADEEWDGLELRAEAEAAPIHHSSLLIMEPMLRLYRWHSKTSTPYRPSPTLRFGTGSSSLSIVVMTLRISPPNPGNPYVAARDAATAPATDNDDPPTHEETSPSEPQGSSPRDS
ncbi:hypothetical protein Tco_1281871 [Tanacetum coccineum]